MSKWISGDRMPDHDIDLYAKWSKKSYDVVFNTNIDSAEVLRDQVLFKDMLPTKIVTKRGYRLTGWYTTDNFEINTRWDFENHSMPAHPVDDFRLDDCRRKGI